MIEDPTIDLQKSGKGDDYRASHSNGGVFTSHGIFVVNVHLGFVATAKKPWPVDSSGRWCRRIASSGTGNHIEEWYRLSLQVDIFEIEIRILENDLAINLNERRFVGRFTVVRRFEFPKVIQPRIKPGGLVHPR